VQWHKWSSKTAEKFEQVQPRCSVTDRYWSCNSGNKMIGSLTWGQFGDRRAIPCKASAVRRNILGLLPIEDLNIGQLLYIGYTYPCIFWVMRYFSSRHAPLPFKTHKKKFFLKINFKFFFQESALSYGPVNFRLIFSDRLIALGIAASLKIRIRVFSLCPNHVHTSLNQFLSIAQQGGLPVPEVKKDAVSTISPTLAELMHGRHFF